VADFFAMANPNIGAGVEQFTSGILAGKMKLFSTFSFHENPRYWEREKNQPPEPG